MPKQPSRRATSTRQPAVAASPPPSKAKGFSRRGVLTGGSLAAALSACRTAGAPAPKMFRGKSGTPIPYSESDLYGQGGARILKGDHLRRVMFPIGGIGTGTISVAGNGDLRDWELFNRPAKNRQLPGTFASVWAKPQGAKKGKYRVVRAEPVPGTRGGGGRIRGDAFPHFKTSTFEGAYPFCRVTLEDEAFPIDVSFEAWNPMIPLSVDDSSLPVAIVTYRLSNTGGQATEVALAFSAVNPVGHDWKSGADFNHPGFAGNLIERAETPLGDRGNLIGLAMSKETPADDPLKHGSFAIAAICDDAQSATYAPPDWGTTTQMVYEYGRHLRDTGNLLPGKADMPTQGKQGCWGALAPKVTLQPGETREITFIIGWHFPNRENYWHNYPEIEGAIMRNDYARRYDSAWSVVEYVAQQLPRLEAKSRAFHETLFRSTLPGVAVDAASSQMAIVRTNTCFLLDDEDNGRTLYGFEGSGPSGGNFPLNCTHVWNYAQAVAYLYPELERSMRKVDFLWNMFPDDSMAFRTIVPLGRRLWDWYAAADGQLGTIMRLYREWKNSGDKDFLKEVWPNARRALEHAWSYWDADKDGVIEGEQHNTYDLEFYGPNTLVGSLYMGALRGMAEMGKALGEDEVAAEYSALADQGTAKYEALFNGEYYTQKIPAADSIVAPPTSGANENDPPLRGVVDGEVRGQYGNGCISDQLIGEWMARQSGLGPLFNPDKVRTALASIFKYNFRHDFFEHLSTDRDFARFDERGLLMCTWPADDRPPWVPLYSDEAWTGIEYQTAAHMIYEGLVSEGLAIVKAVRDRHDGLRRNPWNDEEAGDHYARAMASWSVLLAASGFSYAAPDQRIGFDPAVSAEDFSTFFSAGTGWGRYTQAHGGSKLQAALVLQHGDLKLKTIELPGLDNAQGRSLSAKVFVRDDSGQPHAVQASVSATATGTRIDLTEVANLTEGGGLDIAIS